MKKEEILEMSRKENKKKDYAKLEVANKGASLAAISMIILAFIYYSYEILSGKGTNFALYSLITLYNTIIFGYMAINYQGRRKLNTFTSIVWGILTVMLMLQYFNII